MQSGVLNRSSGAQSTAFSDACFGCVFDCVFGRVFRVRQRSSANRRVMPVPPAFAADRRFARHLSLKRACAIYRVFASRFRSVAFSIAFPVAFSVAHALPARPHVIACATCGRDRSQFAGIYLWNGVSLASARFGCDRPVELARSCARVPARGLLLVAALLARSLIAPVGRRRGAAERRTYRRARGRAGSVPARPSVQRRTTFSHTPSGDSCRPSPASQDRRSHRRSRHLHERGAPTGRTTARRLAGRPAGRPRRTPPAERHPQRAVPSAGWP